MQERDLTYSICTRRQVACFPIYIYVPSLDFVQLGYMVLWISHLGETVHGFEFSGNSNDHNMHQFDLRNERDLVKHLIQEGAVRNNTTHALYVNDLPDSLVVLETLR